MSRWMVAGMAVMVLLAGPALVLAGPDRERPPGGEGERVEADLRALNARIGDLEREVAALKAGDAPPADRIEQLTRELGELRRKRDVLAGRLRQGGDAPRPGRPERREGEGGERAAQLKRELQELGGVLERRTAQLKDLIASHGEQDQRVLAERKEIETIRARRDALAAQLKGLEGPRREGEPPKPRPDGPRESEGPKPPPDGPREGEGPKVARPAMPREMKGEVDRPAAGLRERDSEAFEMIQRAEAMERQSGELAQAVRRAEGPEREALTQKLRGHLAELFDLRLRIRQREVQRLEQELKRLTAQLEERKNNKETIVNQRLKDLLGQGERWEW